MFIENFHTMPYNHNDKYDNFGHRESAYYDAPRYARDEQVSRSRSNSNARSPRREEFGADQTHQRGSRFSNEYQYQPPSTFKEEFDLDRRPVNNRTAALRQDAGVRRSNSSAGQKRSADYADSGSTKSPRSSTFGRDISSRPRASTTGSNNRAKRGDCFDPFRVTKDNCKPGTIVQGVLYEEAVDKRLINRSLQGESSATTGVYQLGEEGAKDGLYVSQKSAIHRDSRACRFLHLCSIAYA